MTEQMKQAIDWKDTAYSDELTYAEHQKAQAYDKDKFKLEGNKLTAIDTINPSYYTDMKIAPSDYIYANNIPYFEGNVIKYISRHRGKNGAEDIKKAIKYCEMILEKEYNV